MLPMAYVYPGHMRATRDLLRRRMHLVHTRAEALAHIQNSVSQYNLPPLAKKLLYGRQSRGSRREVFARQHEEDDRSRSGDDRRG
jgi:hypothetical protein